MVFSSIEFLFFFLPVVLIGYYILKRWRKAANVFLSVMSLGFYAFGAPKFFPIMMLSIVMNWLFGLASVPQINLIASGGTCYNRDAGLKAA